MQNRTFIHPFLKGFISCHGCPPRPLSQHHGNVPIASHPPSQFCACSPDTPLSARILRATAHTRAGTAVVQGTLSKFSMEPSVGSLPQHGLKLPRMVVANSIYSPPTWHMALCLNTSESNNVKRTS